MILTFGVFIFKYNIIETADDPTSPVKCPKITRLVLEKKRDTGEALVEVHPKIVEFLKPHQAEGYQQAFKIYNSDMWVQYLSGPYMYVMS